MKKSSFSARSALYRMTLNAMFIAVHVVMGLVPSEFSWQSLPVLLCAFLLTPGDAVTVAVIGSFIEQLHYGIGFGTIVWILPWAVFGAVAGFGAYFIRHSRHVWLKVAVIIVSEVVLNLCNTAALCYFGYVTLDVSSVWLVVMAFIVRMPHALIRAGLSSVVVPLLLPPLKKVLKRFYVPISSVAESHTDGN